MTVTTVLRRIGAAIVLAASAITLPAVSVAQTANANRPPAGLKWEWMQVVVFNGPNFESTGSEADRRVLEGIWQKELQAARTEKDGTRFPSFTLVGRAPIRNGQLVFTMYNSAGYEPCEPAPNGRDANQIYVTCPLRAVKISREGRSFAQDFPAYCMLFLDSQSNPRERNHVEYAIDDRSGIVYFRTIQFGKQVPECNRSIKVGAEGGKS